MNTKHLFIINPKAGKKDRTDDLRLAIARLELSDFTIEVTEYPGHATLLAGAFAENCDGHARIYACGGDGTFGEVIRGVYKLKNVSVGVIPIGSGNDFVRNINGGVRNLNGGKKFDLSMLSDYVLGEEIKVDLLKCGERIGVNAATVGFDCEVCVNFNKIRKMPLVNGSMAYNLSIVRTLFGGLKHGISIYADGELVSNPERKYLLAAGGNGKCYGGGIMGFPLASPSDGYIELITCEAISLPTFVKFIGKFAKGEHISADGEVFSDTPFLKYRRCKSFQIKADGPVNFNLDGEVFSVVDPLVEVLTGAVSVVAPRVGS